MLQDIFAAFSTHHPPPEMDNHGGGGGTYLFSAVMGVYPNLNVGGGRGGGKKDNVFLKDF